MIKHTPGPWTAAVCEAGTLGIFADNRLATVHPNSRQGANARLIAAAPDLLEACQWFASRADHRMSGEEAAKLAWAFIDVVRAAIRKAEGGVA